MISRWTGGPGSGKTYALEEFIRQEVDDGANLDDFAIMSFSKSQTADFAARIARSVFQNEPKKEIDARVRTIHSIALRACRDAGIAVDRILVPGQTKSAPIYKEFMRRHGIPFDPAIGTDDLEDDDRSRANLPAGNKLITINAYLTATRSDDWRQAAADLGLPIDANAWNVQEILAAWQEFKTAGGYLEHEDYVSMAVTEELPPPAAILVVDEYQDTSPAQDALIRSWSTNAETVYIAGDPDQSIYGFRGCDPALLQDFPNVIDRGARNGERPISHRCPASVMAAAETILGRPSNAAPAPRIGSSTHAIITKTADLVWWVETALRYAQERDRDRIFVLTRFRRHVRALANDLAAAGIPCASINPKRIRLWSDVKTRDQSTVNAWQLTQAVRRVSTGKFYDPIPISEASALIAAIMPANARTAILADLKKAASLKIGDVLRWTGENPFRYRTFPQLDRRVTERIYAALDREKVRGHIIVPDQVQIDTIHAAKGLEASVVLLHSAYLRGRMDDLQDARRLAEERRVYFVGATRAEHALVTFDYGSAVKNPLIAGGAAFWQGATA